MYVLLIQIDRMQLSDKRFAEAFIYMGKICIRLQEYITRNDHLSYRGITLSPHQIALLMLNTQTIDDYIEMISTSENFECRIHLGKSTFCTLFAGSFHVNIRNYRSLNEGLMPTPVGMCLTLNEWSKLKPFMKTIMDMLPSIEEIVPCHVNGLACNECEL